MLLGHDYKAIKISEKLIELIKNKKGNWVQIFSKNIVERRTEADWPKPDIIHLDSKNNTTCAYEFKPQTNDKGEYMKGIGQTLSYRTYFDYSALIIPSDPLGKFIKNLVKNQNLHIGLITYKDSNYIDNILDSLKLEIPLRKEKKRNLTKIETSPFWAYYRDASLQEVFLMLKLCKEHENDQYDDIRNKVFDLLFDEITNGNTVTLGGQTRNVNNSSSNRRNYKKNFRALFDHLGFWDSSGRLTELGESLLELGSPDNWDKDEFKNAFASALLINGRHLSLISLIDDFQEEKRNTSNFAKDRMSHSKNIEDQIEKKGYIKRNPKKGQTTTPRQPFVDEFRLWNYLGLFENTEENSYFRKGEGFKFNDKKILKIISPLISTGTARR